MSHDVVVVGATSQLGQTLKPLRPEWRYISQDELDLTRSENLAKFFSTRPRTLINFAAYTAVDLAEQKRDEALRINTQAVGELAQCCERFMHISTDYVFNGEAQTPYGEDHPTQPVNYYGETKLLGEKAAFAANSKTMVIRTSWLYSNYGVNFVKRMLELSRTRDNLKIVNDQRGSPTYALDLVNAVVAAVENGLGTGVYNFSNLGDCTWYEFTKEIFRLKNVNTLVTPITTAEYPTPAKRPAYSVLDKTKIARALDLKIPTWQHSLAEFLKEHL